MEIIRQSNITLHGILKVEISRNHNNAAEYTTSKTYDRVIDLPIPRNLNFRGREMILHNLSNIWTDVDNMRRLGSPATCSLYGMSGVGKTAIALEFAYSHQHQYHSIFWITAES